VPRAPPRAPSPGPFEHDPCRCTGWSRLLIPTAVGKPSRSSTELAPRSSRRTVPTPTRRSRQPGSRDDTMSPGPFSVRSGPKGSGVDPATRRPPSERDGPAPKRGRCLPCRAGRRAARPWVRRPGTRRSCGARVQSGLARSADRTGPIQVDRTSRRVPRRGESRNGRGGYESVIGPYGRTTGGWPPACACHGLRGGDATSPGRARVDHPPSAAIMTPRTRAPGREAGQEGRPEGPTILSRPVIRPTPDTSRIHAQGGRG
jgi:hypothetical protein